MPSNSIVDYPLNFFVDNSLLNGEVAAAAGIGKSKQARLQQLKINEIFYSLQGESTLSGLPTVFVRLTGCPLRCSYCDAEYAFYSGEWLSFSEIVKQIKAEQTPYVCITGGEPLAQRNCIALLSLLCDQGFTVSLETSGALDVSRVDKRVIKVMDLKTPTSGEAARNKFSNLDFINRHDQIKFVIGDYQDYLWSRAIIYKYNLLARCECLFSVSYGQLQERDLAQWMLADKLNARLQLQIHKYLWGDIPGV